MSVTRIRCWWRGHHNPVRHPLGGFKCADCGMAGGTLDDMGFEGQGFVSLDRPIYARPHGTITRDNTGSDSL